MRSGCANAKHVEQIKRIARPARQASRDDDALLMSVLTGFPDRVARLRSGNQVLMSTGRFGGDCGSGAAV